MSNPTHMAVAKFIETHVSSSPYSVGEITAFCGFKSSEMIEGFIRGEWRVPIDKVPPLAQALGCDKRQLFILVLSSWFDKGIVSELEEALGSVSPAESSWLVCLREFYAGQVPKITPNSRRRLRLIVGLPGSRSRSSLSVDSRTRV
jgi:hypothetical protein